MPVHDWTRVAAAIFHDFHLCWIATLSKALNNGVLPPSHYSMIEPAEPPAGVEPPAIPDDTKSEAVLLASRRRRWVIRRETDDRIVSLVEVVLPGSKASAAALEAFVDKAVGALDEGYRLLVVDLLLRGSFDPRGMQGAFWSRFGGSYDPSAGKRLTLAAYVASAGQAAGAGVTCWVEPTAVRQALVPMPLFLDPEHYVNVPLEETYLAAYEGVPRRWKRVIKGESATWPSGGAGASSCCRRFRCRVGLMKVRRRLWLDLWAAANPPAPRGRDRLNQPAEAGEAE